MRSIIIGGGNVGIPIARRLIAENHNVIIIERDENVVKLTEHGLDAMIVHGSGLDQAVLESTGIRQAELLVAVTKDDHTNLIASIIARKMNPQVKTVVRLEDLSMFEHANGIEPSDFAIDRLINYNNLVINKIMQVLHTPMAEDVVGYPDDGSVLGVFKVRDASSLVNTGWTKLEETHPELHQIRLVNVIREGKPLPKYYEQPLQPNDRLYMLGADSVINGFAHRFSPGSDMNSAVIITGGGMLVRSLARSLLAQRRRVTIVHDDNDTCRHLADELPEALIIHGSSTGDIVPGEIKYQNSCFLGLSNDDEFNVIASLRAKQQGAERAICMVRNNSLVSIVRRLTAIDTVFSPEILPVKEVLSLIRGRRVRSVMPLFDLDAELVEFDVPELTAPVSPPLAELDLPPGVHIFTISRGREIYFADGRTTFHPGDVVKALVPSRHIGSFSSFLDKTLVRKKS